MPLVKFCFAALAARVAGTDPKHVSLLGFAFDPEDDSAPRDAPEWCKSSDELTALQRKERAVAEGKLAWAKKEAEELGAKNEASPEWLREMVTKGKQQQGLNWALDEAKRRKVAGEPMPEWLIDRVKEGQKGAQRWAACRRAELRAAGEEVPQWMADNARQAIVDAANEKIQDLQEEISELQEMEQNETIKVDAGGDVEKAEKWQLAATEARERAKAWAGPSSMVSVEAQGEAMQLALAALTEPRVNRVEARGGIEDAKSAAKRLLEAIDIELARISKNKA